MAMCFRVLLFSEGYTPALFRLRRPHVLYLPLSCPVIDQKVQNETIMMPSPERKSRSKVEQNNYTPIAHSSPQSSTKVDDSFPSTFSRTKWPLLIAIAAAVWLSITLAYAFIVSFKMTADNPTTVTRKLRILSEGITVLLVALFTTTSSLILWAAVGSKQGLSVSTWLSMSSTTGLAGLFKLWFWSSKSRTRDWHRPWILLR